MTNVVAERPRWAIAVLLLASACGFVGRINRPVQAQTTVPALASVPAEYSYFVVGNPDDVIKPTRPGLVLQGGGTDIEESFQWMLSRSGGGDFVVLRAKGTDAYNQYVLDLTAEDGTKADSVATLIVPSREAAADPFVIATIRNAEALWLAGGDQAEYLKFWKGTPVEAAIHHVIAKGAPVGGTSSGLAVMGRFLYSAERDSSQRDHLTSKQALADPFHPRVTLYRDFLALPFLDDVLVESHFVEEDRMGRMITFMGRIASDGWSEEVKGIGLQRQTALLVEPDGQALVIGHRRFAKPVAYFLRMTRPPEMCEAGKLLTVRDVQVIKVTPSGTFDLRSWTAVEGFPYTVSVEEGQVHSSVAGGVIYP